MIKQNDVINYTAQDYANCETVGVCDGVTVFVPFLIKGEQARVKVDYVKKNVAYGNVIDVTRPSDKRVSAPCPHFTECGGCSLMHMTYAEQLVFKRNKVASNLGKIAHINVNVPPCGPSPHVLGYRNKLSLPVSGKQGDIKIGMYRRNSHNVVDMDDCLLGGDWSKSLVRLFRRYCNEQGIVPYDEHTFTGEVRHLVARCVDGQLLVAVVSNGEFRRDLQPLINLLSAEFDKFGLFVNVNDNKNNVIMGKTTRHVYGLKYIESIHLGVKTRLSLDSFFQVNDEVKNAIYLKVKRLLDLSATEALIDCFSGVGVLTNTLASDEYETYAIEIVPQAVENARETAALNGKRITNICGDVNVELPKLTAKLRGKNITLVVDPPRKGLGQTVCNTILRSAVDNLVYISCDSATLARDLALLSSKYEISYVQPYDMFPQTDNVETVVRLVRKT